MKKTILMGILLSCSIIISAQIKAVTENGDTINVYENGTWEMLINNVDIVEIESTVEANVTVDEFDNNKIISTENWVYFGSNTLNKKISGSLLKVNDMSVFIITYYGDLGCFSEYSTTMKVKLSNGTVIEFSQISDTDCGDSPTARFIPLTREELKNPDYQIILDENIEQLKNYDWVTIRLTGSEYYTDITPLKTKKIENPEQFFRQHIIAAENK